ncbi:hypothetical protein QMK19_28920 [Streptomyces sp. H10-C2]|uniref:hypothetical protein n=1 Tax=Streptomyces TaxID=1883 RepID=UPI0018E0515D|nr:MULTISPECIES: hypothetical protein [Streptomyces]MDJ0344233.1 hypothetical protein [Streptomyces sp. PH10-H1]MDJ0373571.1 hypothetical protein [Streptomyces sp. H10-C2]
MSDLVFAATDAAHHLTTLAIPNPGQGGEPPFAQKLLTILGWVAWGVTLACVAGVLIVAGKMAMAHNRGEGGEHARALGMVGAACIIAGSASAIVGTLWV